MDKGGQDWDCSNQRSHLLANISFLEYFVNNMRCYQIIG